MGSKAWPLWHGIPWDVSSWAVYQCKCFLFTCWRVSIWAQESLTDSRDLAHWLWQGSVCDILAIRTLTFVSLFYFFALPFPACLCPLPIPHLFARCPLCPSPACTSFPGPNQPCTPTPDRAPFQHLTLRTLTWNWESRPHCWGGRGPILPACPF